MALQMLTTKVEDLMIRFLFALCGADSDVT